MGRQPAARGRTACNASASSPIPALDFAAGSIYWLKPEVIKAIERMDLQVDDFEPEQGATDGTTAHAFERTLGYLAADAGLEIRETA